VQACAAMAWMCVWSFSPEVVIYHVQANGVALEVILKDLWRKRIIVSVFVCSMGHLA